MSRGIWIPRRHNRPVSFDKMQVIHCPVRSALKCREHCQEQGDDRYYIHWRVSYNTSKCTSPRTDTCTPRHVAIYNGLEGS